MKKRLNIITLVLFFALGLHSAHYLNEAWYDFKSGYKEAANPKEVAMKEHHWLTLMPKEHGVLVDSVYNEKSNAWLPARIQTMEVQMDEPSTSTLWIILTFFFAFVVLGAFIMTTICFIQLILRINKSIIFDKENIMRLRLMGIGLLIIFLCNFIVDLHSLRVARDTIAIPGYRISGSEVVSALSFVLGIISFLVGEVFAIGMRLKEEQELTI